MKRPVPLVATAAALALLLGGCSTDTGGQGAPAPAPSTQPAASTPAGEPEGSADGSVPADVAALLEPYDLQGKTVREVVEGLDQEPQARPLAVQASVRHDEVVFVDGERQVSVPVPGDEVYVSIAPYLTTTHDCFFHALGGCQGELIGEQVHVTITDSDGEVLVDEDTTTYANGFVGYWLPKDRTGTIEITQGDRSGEVQLDTGEDGATCITTLQLR